MRLRAARSLGSPNVVVLRSKKLAGGRGFLMKRLGGETPGPGAIT